MSEGVTQTPPSGRAEPTSGRSSDSAQIARILKLPQNLEQVLRARRLEGEVVAQNRDGAVKVRTPQGDIDIQIKGRQVPQTGQKVEIDLPAGQPPRQLVVRPAPQPVEIRQTSIQSQSPPRDAGTQQTASPRATTQQLIERVATPRVPLPPGYQPSPQTQALPATPQQAPLNTGDVVRFLPVPPAQAQQILQQPAAPIEIQPTQLQRLPFVANVIAQNAQSDLANIALQIRPQVIQQAAAQLNTTLPSPASNAGQPLQTTQPLAAQLIPQVFNAAQPQNIVAGLPLAAPPSAISNSLVFSPADPITLAPLQNLITTTAAQIVNSLQQQTQNTALPRLTQIDAQILQIKPPGVELVSPPLQTQSSNIGAASALSLKLSPPILGQTQPIAITAQVTGFTTQNLPLVTLQIPGTALPQNFIIQFNASNLQIGSQIQILPQTAALPVTPVTGQQVSSFADLLRGWAWPTVDELYQSLVQAAPQAAHGMARAMPSPGNPAQLSAAAMFFIGAIKSGDLNSWLGDRRIDLLQRIGRGDALGRLSQEASTLNRPDPVSGEWRAIPLPMFWENEIHKITLYTRHDGGNSNDEDKKGQQTRFIFDLNLTRMGDVQLDGLLRGQRLDLIVRTQNPFSVTMQQAMRQAYVGALESTNLQGELNFQGDPRQWVNVLKNEKTLGMNA